MDDNLEDILYRYWQMEVDEYRALSYIQSRHPNVTINTVKAYYQDFDMQEHDNNYDDAHVGAEE